MENDLSTKCRPGQVRDAIIRVMKAGNHVLSIGEIEEGVSKMLNHVSASSIRSYLRLNTPNVFIRQSRGLYRLQLDLFEPVFNSTEKSEWQESFSFGKSKLIHHDCFDWLQKQPDESIHAIVTDPPYGLYEYSPEQQIKLRKGKGGVWRIPPSFDGHQRSPLPRFTTLTHAQLEELRNFFYAWARSILPKLVPGANIVVASNPLLSYIVAGALTEAGLERRGEIIRLVMTMRGGDRPKAAHKEFNEVSVMPRSMWEPWLIYRKALEGRAQDNLRKWKTGGFRRPSGERPFGDVIRSTPTRACEKELAPHPSLKPQAFMRQLVRAVLPLGEGIILDPFAGAGSTLAAAQAIGYDSIGIEKDENYFLMACKAIPHLSSLSIND